MIILVWGERFRVAAIRAGVRGWGQGSAGRPTAQRHSLDARPGRRILSVAGPAGRGGERTVFLGPVVPDRMHPHDLPVAGHLDRVGHDRDLHTAAPPSVPDLIHGAGERQLSGAVDDPGYRHPAGWLS